MKSEMQEVLLRSFGRFYEVELQLDWAEQSWGAEDGALYGWCPLGGEEERAIVEWSEFGDTYIVKWPCQGEVLMRRQACAKAWVGALRREVRFPWIHGEDVGASMGEEDDEGDGVTQVRIVGPSLGATRPPELHKLAFDAMRFVAEKVLADEAPG